MPQQVSTQLHELAQLDSPSFYADNPYPVLAQLRREAPVYWYEAGRFWALTKHADITTVETDHVTYSAARQGNRLADRRGSRRLVEGARPIFGTDPPEHTKYRRLVNAAFTPRRVAALEPTIRDIIRQLLGSVHDGVPVDFVGAVAEPLPIFVIAGLLGLPRADWERLKRWSDVRVEILDVEPGSRDEQRLHAEIEEYFSYLERMLAQRRQEPEDDLISAIAELDSISVPDQVQLLNALVVAGNETTRSALSCAAATFAQFPEQWRKLTAAPAEWSAGATEEVLRWATPIVHFARTATADTTLGGEQIAEDDFVVMLYPSANRDESVWDQADTFDITRASNHPHLAFGTGIHFCLGAGLARLEIRVALEELVDTFRSWQLGGEVERLASTHTNQYARVPVVAGR